jgi:hypothetical protein
MTVLRVRRRVGLLAAGGVAAALALSGRAPVAAKAPDAAHAIKPLEPVHVIKPAAGYFDEAFAIDPGGHRLLVLRTDGATFAKLEAIDLATGKTTTSFDLPSSQLVVERLEPLADGQGAVLIVREGPAEGSRVSAMLVDGAGKVVKKVGPVSAFGRPLGSPSPSLLAFDLKHGEHELDATYTITAFRADTLAPVGKPHVYRTVGGELKNPPFRVLDFIDGYARIVGERPRAYDKKNDVRQPPRMATLDTLTGKIAQESEIGDVMSWLGAARQRARHPGQVQFAELNSDDAGVDVVDAMGKKQVATLAAPFELYDAKSLRDQEGPEAGAFYFGLSVDPLNAEAIKRQKPDLPMLDLYTANLAQDKASLSARVFTPRPVTWRAGYGRLVVLKRFKSFTRGGDELDVYVLH